jgi:hypothetical protein
MAWWERQVHFTPDPLNNGQLTPGLAGRFYLFGPKVGHPMECEGRLTIDLYDDGPVEAGAPSKKLEQWQFDANSLKKLLRRDNVGWGYTVFLPWASYRPDITKVRLMVRFDPA